MTTEKLTLNTDYIVSEYLAGKSVNKISSELGVSRIAIENRIKNRGVTLRTQSEAEAVKWQAMTSEQRAKQVMAANNAARGREQSFEEKCKRAKTKSIKISHDSEIERFIISELTARGVECVPQFAIGPYNCDFACGTVAVEVFAGHWHWSGRHLARTDERFRYIMNSGHDILVIVVSASHPFTPAVADNLVREINILRSNPPAIRQYRVIWGTGKYTTTGTTNDDHISIKPPFANRRNATTGQYETVSR